jgi:putative hydrolase
LILGIDAEYRKKAAANQLKKIAPKKFNPEGKAWLPIMSTEREGWRFTVLFSNTQRAHDLGKTNDWVVVYYDDGSGERKCTVVTEFKGEVSGKRVIRGREKECGEYYETAAS